MTERERTLADWLDALGQTGPRGEPGPGWRAAEVLGRSGDRDLVAPLLAALASPRWRRRAQAASALGDLGAWDALVGLDDALRDGKARVRRSIVRALARLGDPPTREDRRRRRLALRRAVADRDAPTRLAAIGGLIRLGAAGDPEIAALVALVDAAPTTREDRDARIRALDLLAELGPSATAALPVVRLALSVAPDDRRAAATLALLRPRLAIDRLLARLSTGSALDPSRANAGLPPALRADPDELDALAAALDEEVERLIESATPPAAVSAFPRPPHLPTETLASLSDTLVSEHHAWRGDVLPATLWRLARAAAIPDMGLRGALRWLDREPARHLAAAPGRAPILDALPGWRRELLAHLGQPEAAARLGGPRLVGDVGGGFVHAPRRPRTREVPEPTLSLDDPVAGSVVDWIAALDGWGEEVRARALLALLDDAMPVWIRAAYADWGPPRVYSHLTRLIRDPGIGAIRALSGVGSHPTQGCSAGPHSAGMIAHHATRLRAPRSLQLAAGSAMRMWTGPVHAEAWPDVPRPYAVPLDEAAAHLRQVIARALAPWALGAWDPVRY